MRARDDAHYSGMLNSDNILFLSQYDACFEFKVTPLIALPK